MDPKLLDYYNQELTFMREMAGEFSRAHPKIARRLGMQGIEVADPYVERLIEAFCLLSARVQIKLDAEFPRFTERLLEVIYPNYVAPTPSMAVVAMHPAFTEGDFSRGFVLPKGSALKARVPRGEETAVEFRTGQAVTLWPLEIVDARLSGPPPDAPNLTRYLAPHIQVKGALRLRLKINGKLNFSELQGLDQLPIYLQGEERIASHLFELIHTGAVAAITAVPGQVAQTMQVITKDAVSHVGFNPDENLLPLAWNSFLGTNLLHEYFACPARFLFFSLNHLAEGLSHIQGQEVEIIILLNKAPDNLASHVEAKQFALFCTPVINLFPKRTDHRTVLADLRQIMIDKSAASRLSVRDVERALAIPRMADALQPDSLALQMRSLWAQEHPVIFDLSQAHAQVVRIVAWAQSDLGSDAPDLSALLALLAPFQRDAALHITAQPSIESDQTIHPHSSSRDATPAPVMEPALPTVNTPTSDTPPTSNAMTQTSATPHSRQDALSLVRIARVWFETHEPSSPVADLLRQAEKLTGKSYLEIADAIPLDLLARWRAASHQDT